MRIKKVKVLVVDDSAVMRQLLVTILSGDSRIEVVGSAADPLIAREMIKKLNPDVLTLDVDMPRMDGLTFLEHLMRLRPMPVVMVSSLTERGASATIRALQLGAVDFLTKPNISKSEAGIEQMAEELLTKVLDAATAKVRRASTTTTLLTGAPVSAADVVAIGASVGGTQAISEILRALPRETPGVAIVQHMPPRFTTLFAAQLDGLSALDVREAVDGDRMKVGTALIAPGGMQMTLIKDSGGVSVRIRESGPVNHHQPSVDVLFDSVATSVGSRALGVLLTGMGADGARGLLAMRAAGAHTIAQAESSCVVFGMPDQAIKLGAVRDVAALADIPKRILAWAQRLKTDKPAASEQISKG